MAIGNINYNAVLADLESRRDELESAIAAVKAILAAGGGAVGGDMSGGVIDPENVPVGSFLRLTIVDAVKKLLDMTKVKLGVPQIAKALERGGLPPAKPNTIYAVLRRRESEVGDLIRFGDEWALSEWYPNNPNLRKKIAEKTKGKGKSKTAVKKKSAPQRAKPGAKGPKTVAASASKTSAPTGNATTSIVKTHEAAESVLIAAGKALDVNEIVEKVNAEFGKKLNANLIVGLLKNDKRKRFVNVSDHNWDLAERVAK